MTERDEGHAQAPAPESNRTGSDKVRAGDEKILDTERRYQATRLARIGRLRRWLKPLPRRANLSNYPVIRHFASIARKNPHLWSFEEPALRRAIYAGAVIALLPIYGLQLLFALTSTLEANYHALNT